MKRDYLTAGQLAERLGVSARTLARMRAEGRGPAYIKMAPSDQGHIRYSLVDVEAWEDSQRLTNTAQKSRGAVT